MLPDYIIYDELEQERRDEDDQRPRKRVELPKDPPAFDDAEREEQEEENENDRGVTIIDL